MADMKITEPVRTLGIALEKSPKGSQLYFSKPTLSDYWWLLRRFKFRSLLGLFRSKTMLGRLHVSDSDEEFATVLGVAVDEHHMVLGDVYSADDSEL